MDITAWLEGPLDSLAGEMSTTLQQNTLIPTSQPFGSFYAGSENVANVPTDVTDWIYVRLYYSPTESTSLTNGDIVHEGAYSLKNTGETINLDGSCIPEVLPTRSGPLRVFIKTRNHLNFISADTLSPTSDIHTLDTRTNGGIATSPTVTITGQEAIPAGLVETTLTPNDIDIPDGLEAWLSRNAVGVYQVEDVNMDGNVDASDRALVFNNMITEFSFPE